MITSAPLSVVGSRTALVACLIFNFLALYYNLFPGTDMSYSWLLYLLIIYLGAERFYYAFLQKGIDVYFAYPLLLAIYILNTISMTLQAQEKFPLLNRAEHLASNIFLTFVIWVFFLQYLPQSVWRDHSYYTALLVFAIATTIGVFNEIIELSLDGLLNTKLIGTDPFDTPLDLLMNALGSGLFLVVRLVLGTSQRALPS
jgi:hypothetical protein